MQLRLHNTLTRTKEVFEPIDPNRVRLYVCGPTVYQRIHVGNARSFVVFDVLYRLLRHLYGERERRLCPQHHRHRRQDHRPGARRTARTSATLTERTTADFHADLAALGCLPPTHEPRATEHVPGMIALIADADRARPRLRRRGPRPVQRPLDAGLRPPVRPQPRRADRRRAGRRRPLQARPRRLRPVEALDRRPARLGQPLGPRPPRLAHRVLGHERGASWARSRSTSTPAAST